MKICSVLVALPLILLGTASIRAQEDDRGERGDGPGRAWQGSAEDSERGT